MDDVKDSVKELAQKLKTERDELQVQLKLSSMEFRDHWNAAEVKWNRLEQKMADLSHESADATRTVANELAETYRTLRDIVKR